MRAGDEIPVLQEVGRAIARLLCSSYLVWWASPSLEEEGYGDLRIPAHVHFFISAHVLPVLLLSVKRMRLISSYIMLTSTLSSFDAKSIATCA